MVGGARVHGIRYGRQSLALDVVEAFRQPIVDRLTLRVLNLRQIQPDDFEGGEQGTRLLPDALKRYLGLYDEQMRSESDGTGTPTWRGRLREQVEGLAAMVMSGTVSPLYTWGEATPASPVALLTAAEGENPGRLADAAASAEATSNQDVTAKPDTLPPSLAAKVEEDEGGG